MDRFKQKAIANAVGITDMAEANKLFGMSMAEYEGYAAQVDKAEASQKALDEATAKAIPVLKSLQLAVADFVAEYGYVIQNILEGTLDIAKSFLEWKKNGDWIEPWGFAVVGIIGSIVAVMGVMVVMTIKITGAMAGLAATAGTVATSLGTIAAAGGGIGLAGGTAAVAGGGAAAAAGGTALLPILAGIALVAGAAYGVSKLFEGNERTTATTQAQQRTASEDYVIDNATLNLTFSAEETVRISKVLTKRWLKS